MYPHYLIGAITGKHHGGQLVKSTGAQISSNLVLTAAHAIFDGIYGREYEDLRFHPKAYGVFRIEDGIKIDGVRYLDKFKALPRKDLETYDYALIKLAERIPRVRYLTPYTYCHQCLKSSQNR